LAPPERNGGRGRGRLDRGRLDRGRLAKKGRPLDSSRAPIPLLSLLRGNEASNLPYRDPTETLPGPYRDHTVLKIDQVRNFFLSIYN
jgi:hypothetical protein